MVSHLEDYALNPETVLLQHELLLLQRAACIAVYTGLTLLFGLTCVEKRSTY